MNKIEEGFQQLKKAKELNPSYQGVFLNAGVLYAKQNNLLFSEEMYRRSIEMNTEHYLPFERLGNIYLRTTNYALADSFLFEADLRKKGFHFVHIDADADGVVDQLDLEQYPPQTLPCVFNLKNVQKNDVAAHFVMGFIEFDKKNFSLAKEHFKTVAEFDRRNPLVYHYLGKMAYMQEQWLEAEVNFNLAISNFLEKDDFNKYCDSLKKQFSSNDRACIIENFKKQYYSKLEDFYFLSSVYEKLNFYTEAEEIYKKIISIKPEHIGGYYKLWNLYEKIYRYDEVVSVILSYKKYKSDQADNELFDFYKRMIHLKPADATWNFKAGNFLYNLVLSSPEKYGYELNTDKMSFFAIPSVISNNPENILPGTGEFINEANAITNPRNNAISFFLKADSLLEQSEVERAEVNFKIGDLYMMLRQPLEAAKYYKKSVDILPINSSVRLKLANIYDPHFYYQAAMEQLDSLDNKNELSFPALMLLAKYTMHAGAFERSEALLQKADTIYPYKIFGIDDLKGRLNLLAANPKKALPFYDNYLSANPGDYSTMYTIAKLYALTNNQQAAWKWLDKAISSGFRYSWVLKYDTVWEKYRTSSKWNAIQSRYQMKTYSTNRVQQ